MKSVANHDGKTVVTMMGKNDKQTKQAAFLPCRTSKRAIKAKRKLDFVYDNGREKKVSNERAVIKNVNSTSHSNSGKNNNAQIVRANRSTKLPSVKGSVKRVTKGRVSQKVAPENNRMSENAINKNVFDGIKVSVNSDEEELDYEDNVFQDDDEGSIMEQQENDTMDRENGPCKKVFKEMTEDVQTADANTDMVLGASSASMTEEDLVMNNPHLRKLLNRMLDERIQDAARRGEMSSSQLLTSLSPKDTQGHNHGNDQGQRPDTNSRGKNMKNNGINAIKSPSDTPIYVPALQRNINPMDAGVTAVSNLANGVRLIMDNVLNRHDIPRPKQVFGSNEITSVNKDSKAMNLEQDSQQEDPIVMMKISNFVDQMRLDADADLEVRPKSTVVAPRLAEAQKRMEQAVVEAEKYKAAIEKPPGRNFVNTCGRGIPGEDNQFSEINVEEIGLPKCQQNYDQMGENMSPNPNQDGLRQMVGAGLSDDFFHLTCHIDQNLKEKD